MNCIIVTEKHCRNPFLTQNEVTGTWLIFKYLFLPTLCTSRKNMAKLWAFSCYLTCLTLFCHFVSHAHQEMTDFFTGIHRPRKTTSTKTGKIYKIIPIVFFKRFPSLCATILLWEKKIWTCIRCQKTNLFKCIGLPDLWVEWSLNTFL